MIEVDKLVVLYRNKTKKFARGVYNMALAFKTIFWLSFVIHCLACIWIYIGLHNNWSSKVNCWIDEFGIDRSKKWDIYVNSFELITATFTTIGYGSVYAVNA